MSKRKKVFEAAQRLKVRSCTCTAYVISNGIKQPYYCPHKTAPKPNSGGYTEVNDLAKLNRGTKYGVTNPPSHPKRKANT